MSLTTDDGFIRAARALRPPSPVRVEDPVIFETSNDWQLRLLPLPKLRRRGFVVLVRELGAANALRFLHLYAPGQGDTQEPNRWLGELTIEQIEEEIRRLRAQGQIWWFDLPRYPALRGTAPVTPTGPSLAGREAADEALRDVSL
jgi:hypothetical protein